MERNYDCGCTYVVDHFSNDILIDHEAKLWPLLVLLMYRWTVFWDFLNSVFQVILFFKSSLRPWKEFIQKYLVVVETFSQRMWWLLLWGGYIWEKSTIKNRATKKPFQEKIAGSKIQYYSKHILLQTPAKTTRNTHHLHLHGVPSPPHSLAKCQENLQKIHPSDQVFS